MDDFHYAHTLTRDAEAHAAGLSAWDQRYEQLSAGVFEGEVEDFRVGPAQVFRERATRDVLQSGRPRAGTLTLGLTRAGAGTGRFCGHRLDDDQAIVVSADGEFDLLAVAGMTLQAVCIDTAQLHDLSARLHGPDAGLGLGLAGPCVLKHSAMVRQDLRQLLDSAMTTAREQPALLAQPAARRMLALSLADAVLDCLAPTGRQAELPVSAAARRQVVARARDYMQAHADEVITVPQLCEATRASRRTLQYAFEEFMHLSPVTYLRVMRLNRVRSELQARRADTVGDVAARWGFWHLSRFAAEYRALFGELPSATRQRPA